MSRDFIAAPGCRSRASRRTTIPSRLTGTKCRFAGNLYGPGRDRTCDLGIKSPLLYRLSYRPAILLLWGKGTRKDLPSRSGSRRSSGATIRRRRARRGTGGGLREHRGGAGAPLHRLGRRGGRRRALRVRARLGSPGRAPERVGRAPTRRAGARRGAAGRPRTRSGRRCGEPRTASSFSIAASRCSRSGSGWRSWRRSQRSRLTRAAPLHRLHDHTASVRSVTKPRRS